MRDPLRRRPHSGRLFQAAIERITRQVVHLSAMRAGEQLSFRSLKHVRLQVAIEPIAQACLILEGPAAPSWSSEKL